MRPHRTDGISLSFGTIFLLVAVWWAVAQLVDVKLPAAGWLVAGALILFGVIGLLGAIRSGRRPEMAPVQAEAQVETPGDLPPELHADIVRELLDNPADRIDLKPADQGATHPAYLKHPVPETPVAARPSSAPPAGFAPPGGTAPASAPPAPAGTAPGGISTAGPGDDEPTVQVRPAAEASGVGTAEVAGDEPTTEVTRVDLSPDDASSEATDRNRDRAQDGDPDHSPRMGRGNSQ